MNLLRDQRVLVLGLGDSGLAMARWARRCGAAQIRVADSRSAPPQAAQLAADVPEAALVCGAFTPALADGVQLVLKSPGLSPLDPAVAVLIDAAEAQGARTLGELGLFAHALADLKAARGYAPQVIAITGTNGKTTTTALTALLIERAGLRVAMAGNIGPTMLDTLGAALDLEPDTDPQLELLPVVEVDVEAEPVEALEHEHAEEATDAALVESRDEPTEAAVEDLADLAALDGVELDEVSAPADAAADAADASGDDSLAARVERIEGAGPPAHLVPPAPPGPEFEHLPQAWVLELSSFQLDGVTGFEPTAAAVLNVTQDHLDWHGDLAAYAEAKARIYGPRGSATSASRTVHVINRDDPRVEAMLPQAPEPTVLISARTGKALKSKPVAWTPPTVVRFGLDQPRRPGDWGLVVEHGMAWLVRAHETEAMETRSRRQAGAEAEVTLQRLMPADALRIRGRHNAANALAALALATAAGVPLAPMLHGLREYRGEPHRVEYLQSIDGIDAYDDSKGTNVGATVAALTGLGPDKAPAKLVVILGGDGKGQDFTPLVAAVAAHARAVALIGRDAAAIGAVLADLAANGLPVQAHDRLEAATRWCFEQARSGDAVLLSPACASLDMFRHYAHRAQVFADTVAAIASERGEFGA
ncbi:MAG: UDP-N-acetylmuramoyl-L-alanine--D-glutamate ligase [Leptothrix sp. (in: b-proteobacteria)]